MRLWNQVILSKIALHRILKIFWVWSCGGINQLSGWNYMHFLYKQRILSTQPQCCLTFSWIELQMLLRCCLIPISIIILRHFLYLLWLCLCLDLGLLCRIYMIYFLFSSSFSWRLIVWIQTHLFLGLFFRKYAFLDDNVDENVNNFQLAKVQPQGVA